MRNIITLERILYGEFDALVYHDHQLKKKNFSSHKRTKQSLNPSLWVLTSEWLPKNIQQIFWCEMEEVGRLLLVSVFYPT